MQPLRRLDGRLLHEALEGGDVAAQHSLRSPVAERASGAEAAAPGEEREGQRRGGAPPPAQTSRACRVGALVDAFGTKRPTMGT